MILFTSGFPYSGKTVFAEIVKKQLDNKLILHINPKDYYPDNFKSLPSEDQTQIGVTAWELSLETASKAIAQTPNKALIIFDTCCNKSLHMRPLFMNSKICGHSVMMVYLHASLEDRTSRMEPEDVKKFESLEERYKSGFNEALPILKSHADYFKIINNPNYEGFEQHLGELALELTDRIKSIRDG